jgi:tripartite-type tricarboxylate transporter receptor subunit TctC
MSPSPHTFVCAAFAALIAAVPAAPAAADAVADFYKGKSMRMVIRSTTGNEYDLMARTLARHIIRHIPGNPPKMIPVNMPGGGGIKAAIYIASQAPKDGTVLTIVSQGLPMYQALGLGKALKADMKAFNWIGNMSASNQTLVVWHTSKTKTLADAKNRETVVGGSGAGSVSVQLPALYNNVLGTRFKIIYGYPGGAQMNLALERGEIEGRGTNPWGAWLATRPQWVAGKMIVPLIQVGLRKEPELPDVPLLRDLATNDKERAILNYITNAIAVGRPIATTPGVPAKRVKALRAAFDATVKDTQFRKDADRQGLRISPMTGAELQEIVVSLIEAPPPVKAMVKEAIQPRDASKLKGSGKKKKKKKKSS